MSTNGIQHNMDGTHLPTPFREAIIQAYEHFKFRGFPVDSICCDDHSYCEGWVSVGIRYLEKEIGSSKCYTSARVFVSPPEIHATTYGWRKIVTKLENDLKNRKAVIVQGCDKFTLNPSSADYLASFLIDALEPQFKFSQ